MARERMLEAVMLARPGSPSGPARKRQSGAAVVAAFFLTWLLPWGSAAAAQAVEAAPSAPGQALYRLGPGDVVAINVWGHEDLSAVVQVRPDGYVAFPLVGDLLAAGLTPAQLSSRLAEALRTYVREPQVTTIVREFRTVSASVLGQVKRPRTYQLRFDARLTELLGRSEGPLDDADLRRAVLTRVEPDGAVRSVPVDLEAILRGLAVPPAVENGDVLFVPKARPVTVLGAVNAPGAFPVRPGMRLLDLVALASGLAPGADPSRARLTRAPEGAPASDSLTVDLSALMADPASPNNLLVQPGDILFVPEARQLVVMGAVRRPGVYPFTPGMRLLDALAAAGGADPDRSGTSVVVTRGRAQSPGSPTRGRQENDGKAPGVGEGQVGDGFETLRIEMDPVLYFLRGGGRPLAQPAPATRRRSAGGGGAPGGGGAGRGDASGRPFFPARPHRARRTGASGRSNGASGFVPRPAHAGGCRGAGGPAAGPAGVSGCCPCTRPG